MVEQRREELCHAARTSLRTAWRRTNRSRRTSSIAVGKGGLIWLRERPAEFSASAEGAAQVVAATQLAAEKAGLKWRETNYLLLRRGPYVIAAGLDESIAGEPRALQGRFVNLFDSELRVLNDVSIDSRLPLVFARPGCRAHRQAAFAGFRVQGVADSGRANKSASPSRAWAKLRRSCFWNPQSPAGRDAGREKADDL